MLEGSGVGGTRGKHCEYGGQLVILVGTVDGRMSKDKYFVQGYSL